MIKDAEDKKELFIAQLNKLFETFKEVLLLYKKNSFGTSFVQLDKDIHELEEVYRGLIEALATKNLAKKALFMNLIKKDGPFQADTCITVEKEYRLLDNYLNYIQSAQLVSSTAKILTMTYKRIISGLAIPSTAKEKILIELKNILLNLLNAIIFFTQAMQDQWVGMSYHWNSSFFLAGSAPTEPLVDETYPIYKQNSILLKVLEDFIEAEGKERNMLELLEPLIQITRTFKDIYNERKWLIPFSIILAFDEVQQRALTFATDLVRLKVQGKEAEYTEAFHRIHRTCLHIQAQFNVMNASYNKRYLRCPRLPAVDPGSRQEQINKFGLPTPYSLFQTIFALSSKEDIENLSEAAKDEIFNTAFSFIEARSRNLEQPYRVVMDKIVDLQGRVVIKISLMEIYPESFYSHLIESVEQISKILDTIIVLGNKSKVADLSFFLPPTSKGKNEVSFLVKEFQLWSSISTFFRDEGLLRPEEIDYLDESGETDQEVSSSVSPSSSRCNIH